MLTRIVIISVSAILTPLFVAPAAAQGQSQGQGRDWFVRAGAQGGDGSRAKPFADPWQALDKCEARDRVHATEGQYFGKLGTGTWVIPFDGVQLIGGYDTEWKTRDPWRRPTRLCWDPDSKNWPKDVRVGSQARDVVLDGLVLDMQDQNQYLDDQKTSRSSRPSETAMRFWHPATVRNCMVLNPGFHGIDCTPGSLIENNLIVNAIDWGVTVTTSTGDFAKMTAVIKNNTILYCWDGKAPGEGGYPGAAVALRGPAQVANNILAYCDNSAIYSVYEPGKIAVTGNVFFRNKFANLTSEAKGQRAVANDKSMELLEEAGLKACDGNVVVDPELTLDADWASRAGQRGAKPDAKPNAKPDAGIAPACSFEGARALLAPRNASIKAGARIVPLTVSLAAGGDVVAKPSKTYEKMPLTAWSREPEPVNEKPLELIVAIAGGANTTGMPAEYPQDQIAGVKLYDPEGGGAQVTGFYRLGTNVERVCNGAMGYYQGQGKPSTLHLARGIAYSVKSVPKSAFFIEAIERYEPSLAVSTKRPKGQDWFVRAGAMGGDGSRDQPFRDPFQPLERCEAGDTIHVTEGEYVGKLKAGHWQIEMPYIALLGGYDQAFTERNPWAHPSRLVCPADFQGRRGGYTLEGVNDHTGAIVDGFLFDKLLNNVYTKSGSLDVGHSDKTEHVWLASPDTTIRNCVFLNGADGAIRAMTGQLVENNIFVNHVTQVVTLQRGIGETPFVCRNNTLLFSWDKSPGQGRGSNGHLLRLGGQVRAVVENNVFAYADNDAIRLDADPREIVLRGNVFANNLWSHLQQSSGSHTFHDKNWQQLCDLGFKACENNVLLDPQMPVEETWLARYRAARMAAKPEQASAPAPAPVPASGTVNPFDDSAKAPAPAPDPRATGTARAARNPFDDQPDKSAGAGGSSGEVLVASAYDWRKAVLLFPQSSACPAGARAVKLEVKLEGIVRVIEKHEYAETTWAAAIQHDTWDKLVGKRVRLEVAIRATDNNYLLPEAPKADFLCFTVTGPQGSDSAGLPLRCYAPRGTRTQRAVDQAKGFGTGKPAETHVISGIAKPQRQMLVEVIQKVQ